MNREIKILFDEHKGYLEKHRIPDRKTYYQILQLVEAGKIERLKRGLYYYNSKPDFVMIDINKIVPNGALCLYSAWFHYQLTTQIPQSFNVAVDKNRKVVLPDFPPIKLFYWKQEYYELGIIRADINNYTVNIYDLEKAVCDAVKFRNKIGMETTAEILRSYLGREERNYTKLMRYAKMMRIEKIMRTYLEVQL